MNADDETNHLGPTCPTCGRELPEPAAVCSDCTATAAADPASAAPGFTGPRRIAGYRILREIGFAEQMEFHSPTSQYGQLSRRGRFDHLDVAAPMREITKGITSGAFADEWDAESAAGHPKLEQLVEEHAGPGIKAFEDRVRSQLGPDAARE